MKKLLLLLLFPSILFAQPSPPPLITQEGDTSVVSNTNFLDLGSCFDVSASPSNEANISFDSSECTVNADSLKANGSNCSAGSGAGGVTAAGAAEDCTDYYSTLAELQTSVTNDFHNLGGTDDDVPESGDFTNLTDGTNLTFSPAGTLNVDNPVVANLTGNASTATALAANGANCAANSYPLGVDASGAAESCGTNISGNAATATALAANGANCTSGNYPLGVDASGATESCTALTLQHITDQGHTTTNQIQITRTSANADSPEAPLDITATRTEADLDGFEGIQVALSTSGSTAHTLTGRGVDVTVTNSNTTSSTHSLQGLNFLLANGSGAGNINNMWGINGAVRNSSTSTIADMRGGLMSIGGTNTGAVTNAYMLYLDSQSSVAGAYGTWHGIYEEAPALSTGTITDWYGLRIQEFTGATNNYAAMFEGVNKVFWRDANTTIHSSASGNLNLHASSDIDSDQTISFPDNEGTRYGTGDDSIAYYDGTDLIIDPDLVGTGVVRIGATSDDDLIGNRINFCNTAIDTTAYVKGDCTGAARAALNFKLTKTGSNATMGNTITMVNQTTGAAPAANGLTVTISSDTTSETGGTYGGLKVIYSSLQDPAGSATVRYYGYEVTPSSMAAYTSDTVHQVGFLVNNMTLPSGASGGSLLGMMSMEDVALAAGKCIQWENAGPTGFAAGDTTVCNTASGAGLAVTTDALQVGDFDDDLTKIGDVVAGNYLQVYNAASGVIPEGSWKAVGTALFAVDGDKPAFCYSGDVDACLQFSTTNSYEFRDLGGTSRFNLDVVNGDLEVGTANRGIDMVTAANDLYIGRVNAGDIVYGNLANSPSHTFATTDSATMVVMDATVPMQVTQVTVGDKVATLTSTATNDDPQESLRQYRVTTTDATVTTLATVATTTDNAQMIECTIDARRTGGVAGTAGDIAAYKLYCANKNVTGTVTEIAETEAFTAESQAAWDVDCSVSGTNHLVRVTGAANNNVTWHGTCRIYSVGT